MKASPLLAKLSWQISSPSSNFLLETNPLKYQRLQQIGDQPVSRMFSLITKCIGLYLYPVLFKKLDS